MTYYGRRPWTGPQRHEWVCDDCGCYSPIGEECWRCAEVAAAKDVDNLPEEG